MSESSSKYRPRLTPAHLTDGSLAEAVRRPPYDRKQFRPGIVHLGLGAFCRAHLAVYTDDVLADQVDDWAIVGVSLRSPTVADALNPQDGLYTLVEQGDGGSTYRVVGSVARVLIAPEAIEAVLEIMFSPHIKIVSLTVTEKGYCHDPATGGLDIANPDVEWDLLNPDAPRTAIGFLVAGLRARFLLGRDPFTVLSCDNLSNNGAQLRRVILQLAEAQADQLPGTNAAAFSTWLSEAVDFPATMVDRIVPATTEDDRQSLAQEIGVVDKGMVKAEPFSQWIVEDRFRYGRPRWDLHGVTFVDDVRPYEAMKLRLLNGAHSAIAYLSAFLEVEYVHLFVRDDALCGFIRELMFEELLPTLDTPPGFDLPAYCEALLARFANPALAHRTQQIAMDGSQKLPPRLFGALLDRTRSRQSADRILLVIAAWIAFASRWGLPRHGRLWPVDDPLAADLEQLGKLDAVTSEPLEDNATALVRAFVNYDAVFDEALAHEPAIVNGLVYWLDRILQEDLRTLLLSLARER